MSTTPVPLNDLVTKIRAKYPGAYDDMDDASLTKAVLAKYPQYSDLAAPKVQKPNVPMQQSNVGIALGSNADSPMNPMQPGEQWAIQNPTAALGVAGMGAVGAGASGLPAAINATATALTPAIIKAGEIAAAHPVLRSILVEAAKKAAGGTALAAGYKYGKKVIDAVTK